MTLKQVPIPCFQGRHPEAVPVVLLLGNNQPGLFQFSSHGWVHSWMLHPYDHSDPEDWAMALRTIPLIPNIHLVMANLPGDSEDGQVDYVLLD